MIDQIVHKEKILSFRNTGILYYETPVDHRSNLLKSDKFVDNALKLEHRKRYVGQITDGIKKRMRKVITLLIQSTPWQYKQHPVTNRLISHKLSFITLTTPTDHKSLDAKYCHKNLLEPFLRICRSEFGMKSYIWKCELQSNGQVHYHITTDFMVNHTSIRNKWNHLLRKCDMLIAFKAKYGHDDPNSTDIHAVHEVRNLEAYLVKYICKEYQNETALNGKVWDCSKNLKQADYFKLHIDTDIHDYIRNLQNGITVVTTYFEKAILLDFKTSDYYAYFADNIINEFSSHLKTIREWQRNINSTLEATVTTIKTGAEKLKKTLTTWAHVGVQCHLDFPKVGLATSSDWHAISNQQISGENGLSELTNWQRNIM